MNEITNEARLATLRRITQLCDSDPDGDLPCPVQIEMGDYPGPTGGGWCSLRLADNDERGVALWANLLDLGDPELGAHGRLRWYSARMHLVDDLVWLGWRTVEVVTSLRGRS
jgi:hypothetical protein